MIVEQLEKLGLNANESKVYLASLELGESTVQRIAKKAGMKRTTVNSIVNSLLEKGLISKTRSKNKNLYFSSKPKKLS